MSDVGAWRSAQDGAPNTLVHSVSANATDYLLANGRTGREKPTGPGGAAVTQL